MPMSTPEDRFRVVAFFEAISYLLLLGVAMPLKYGFDYPMAVTVVGAIHGGLFVLYMLVVVYMIFAAGWRFQKVFLAGIASIIPFGPFIFDKRLVGDSKASTIAEQK
ncbi:DUF3817 domain-containing protein [Alkalihalobacillus sp. LMS39]|nr:DUF3817 domain-containing protein [Alkalihalobacillus sp. LMS39]UOE96538.1 DUF3817 domain-containing protein [Alkalihalobacillus sp. LMS39]